MSRTGSSLRWRAMKAYFTATLSRRTPPLFLGSPAPASAAHSHASTSLALLPLSQLREPQPAVWAAACTVGFAPCLGISPGALNRAVQLQSLSPRTEAPPA